MAGFSARACSHDFIAASTMPPDRYSEPSRKCAVASFGLAAAASFSTAIDIGRCGNTYVVGMRDAAA